LNYGVRVEFFPGLGQDGCEYLFRFDRRREPWRMEAVMF
jgi:hypothetical protein